MRCAGTEKTTIRSALGLAHADALLKSSYLNHISQLIVFAVPAKRSAVIITTQPSVAIESLPLPEDEGLKGMVLASPNCIVWASR